MDCLFCKIINGEIPSKKVYEDDSVYAFYDIAPMAPVHVLIVPKMHISSVNEVTSENSAVISHIYEVAAQLAKELGISEDGYRIVTNCGKNAGQTVFHLHFHLAYHSVTPILLRRRLSARFREILHATLDIFSASAISLFVIFLK